MKQKNKHLKIPKKFTVSLLQMAIGKNPDDNLKKAVSWIEKAAKNGAQVICLPELFRSLYFCQTEDMTNFNLAETIPGSSTETISKVAKKNKVVVIVPVFEKRAIGVYHNSAVIIDADGHIAGVYRKMHIPDDPAFYEKYYFAPGDLGFDSFKTKYGDIGTLICWDQWYPEAARLTALKGASILFYPTAIGWHPHEKAEHGKAQFESWRTIQRGHAIANGIYVAAVNRVGLEKQDEKSAGIEFWGQSFVADPQGVIIAQASADKEEILFAEIRLERIEYIRQNWPFLRDRRIDAYGGIKERFSGS
ncbi:MAG TPA: carbon-nitrogen hydrolase [Candidatus Acidoferrales bacterium]|nr:carbon-nitrogen hydrolase [Candidatus Acidoferrales bacterium]